MTASPLVAEPVEGQPCRVCGLPDPAHDWDVHDRSPAPVLSAPPLDARRLVGAALPNMLLRSSTRGRYGVRALALHTTEGLLKARDLRAWASWTGSSHASGDADGVLLGPADGFVPYHLAAWTIRSGNPWTENIELCGFARWTRADWLARPKLLEVAARWLAERAVARGIPLVRITPAQYRAGAAGVIDHYTHTVGYQDGTHTDVGAGFPWDTVLSRARALAAPIIDQEDDVAGPVDLTPGAIAAVARAASDAVANRTVGTMPDGTSMEAWESWVVSARPVDVSALARQLVPAILAGLPQAAGAFTLAQLTEATEAGVRAVLTDGVAG